MEILTIFLEIGITFAVVFALLKLSTGRDLADEFADAFDEFEKGARK